MGEITPQSLKRVLKMEMSFDEMADVVYLDRARERKVLDQTSHYITPYLALKNSGEVFHQLVEFEYLITESAKDEWGQDTVTKFDGDLVVIKNARKSKTAVFVMGPNKLMSIFD